MSYINFENRKDGSYPQGQRGANKVTKPLTSLVQPPAPQAWFSPLRVVQHLESGQPLESGAAP